MLVVQKTYARFCPVEVLMVKETRQWLAASMIPLKSYSKGWLSSREGELDDSSQSWAG